MAITYSKKMLIERIEKHLNDGFPGQDWPITENEMLTYIDAAIPGVLKGMMFEMAKVTGVIDVPEAFLVTYALTITNQSTTTKEWYVTLPQTPLELPTGYDVSNVYVTDATLGRSQNALPIKNKRVAFRNFMPKPSGFSYRLEGQTMFLQAADGGTLANYELQVQMPVSRTDSITAPMPLPDGAIQPIFDAVVAKIVSRYQLPKDQIKDDQPAGNKTS